MSCLLCEEIPLVPFLDNSRFGKLKNFQNTFCVINQLNIWCPVGFDALNTALNKALSLSATWSQNFKSFREFKNVTVFTLVFWLVYLDISILKLNIWIK